MPRLPLTMPQRRPALRAVLLPLLLGAATLAVAAPAAEPAPAATPAATPAGCAPVFGSQLFGGRFAQHSASGFNPDYQIAPGDRITLRLWGAFNLDATQAVDPRGNLFLPSIGPVQVLGVRNGDLDRVVQEQVRRTFRANVRSYASLEAAQPVKVYVTGFVRQPGLYGGLSSDSVLRYLDLAGGIDPERGSYLSVDLLRGGERRARVDLYRFLLEGRIDAVQIHDGDTLFVGPRRASVKVSGEAANACAFEFDAARMDGATLIALARPRPGATHMAVVRQRGPERSSEYHPLAEAGAVMLNDGDEVSFTADRIPGTILVRIEGAHRGERTVVLPYGARLSDALARLRPAPLADLDALQLQRRSIAQRQKEMLGQALDRLEAQALTARSATNEEAQLRGREAELVLQFTHRARQIEPRGQLVLPDPARAGDTPLEDGDTLVVPERSAQVAVHGEVLFPMAIGHDPARRIDDYIRLAGGPSQQADTSRVLLLKRNGTVVESRGDVVPDPGDELMVLPRAETKRVEVARGITQVLYQIAVVAKVALGL